MHDPQEIFEERFGSFADQTPQVEQLTADHNAKCPSEQARIISLGGTISQPCNLVDDSPRVNDQLEVTRSLGDLDLKDIVRADADIYTRTITPADQFIVIASDGLWDVVNNLDVVRTCLSRLRGCFSTCRIAT